MMRGKQRHRSGKTVVLLAAVLSLECRAQQLQQPDFSKLGQQSTESQPIRALLERMQVLQQRMNENQQQLDDMRQQLQQLLTTHSGTSGEATQQKATAEEQQEVTSTQIATLDQEKVETASKFPLHLHGTLLLSGFGNSGQVDDPAAPTAALGGPGSTGLTVRQTTLGITATGPHLLGAQSSADLDADFFAQAASGYAYSGLLRLRTAHVVLAWKDASLFFALDHSLLAPYRPESLLAAATPELGGSGNLWNWNPQAGVALHRGTTTRFGFEAALIDAADPNRASLNGAANVIASPSLSEASRWLGVQTRLSLDHGQEEHAAGVGIGGYFSPHRLVYGDGPHYDFNAWAGSVDFRLPLPFRMQLTGTAYRGAGLGGLGGGGYHDYMYRARAGQVQVIALDDVGGWVGLHEALGQRFSWNAGIGFDNPFAQELRAYPASSAGDVYDGVARNRTVFGNMIYAPRAYLLFSAEYRNLHTAPATGTPSTSNVTGLGAAYRF